MRHSRLSPSSPRRSLMLNPPAALASSTRQPLRSLSAAWCATKQPANRWRESGCPRSSTIPQSSRTRMAASRYGAAPKFPEGYTFIAQPQTGQPYFAAKTSVPDRPGFDPLTVDIDLVGGIPLSGRATDKATGKPPRAGMVEYYPLFPNRHSASLTHCPVFAASSSIIQPDGSYHLVALPGPGVVCVAASPRNSYAVAAVDDRE